MVVSLPLLVTLSLLSLLFSALLSPSLSRSPTPTRHPRPHRGGHNGDRQHEASFPWFDPSLPLAGRVSSLLAALNRTEKLSLMSNRQPAIARLGLPYYDFEGEGSHGVARAGRATVFPSPLSLASSFHEEAQYEAGRVVSVEGRAKYNVFVRTHNGSNARWYSVQMLAPNINLFTHARWGRGQETYGEDPFLTGALSSQYVKGMQNWSGREDELVEVGATCKHFSTYGDSVYNNRIEVTETDLRQSYWPAFKKCVMEGRARSVMCSYSVVNGYQACAHPALRYIVRGEWAFNGFIQSDAGAVGLIQGVNNTIKASIALLNGVDQDLDGGEYAGLAGALELGLVKEIDLDRALTRVFSERIRLGLFDPDKDVPYSKYDLSYVDLPASRALARQAAREGTVLLKYTDILPIDLHTTPMKKVAVIGPNANELYTLLGNYDGCTDADGQDPSISEGCVLITPLAAINESITRANVFRQGEDQAAIKLTYEKGCDINSTDISGIASAVTAAKEADVAIVVLGLRSCSGGFGNVPRDCMEGEMLDRQNMALPAMQPHLLRQLIATGTPIILVTMSGSPLTLNEWILAPSVVAILQHWYSGEEGGHGLTDLMFGPFAPSGRLPVTFPFDESQVPFDGNYSMTAPPGRSYRYSVVVPAFSFGFGLSYTTFAYSVDSKLPLITPTHFEVSSINASSAIHLTFSVTNTGKFAGAEVVQVYISYSAVDPLAPVQSIPISELKAFTRVSLLPAASSLVHFSINITELQLVGADAKMGLLRGVYSVHIGGSAPGSRGHFVDGNDHHATSVWYDSTQIESHVTDKQEQLHHYDSGTAAGCDATRNWLHKHAELDTDDVDEQGRLSRWLSVRQPRSIAGGLLAMFTVC